MLPAHRALVRILSKCHRPSKNTRVAKYVIIVTQSAVIRDEKTVKHHRKQFLKQFQPSKNPLYIN